MKNKLSIEEIEFLVESNLIENVSDEDSLAQAKLAWIHLKKQPELTPSVILKTHKILMLHQKLLPSEKGYFRRVPVWIGGREIKDWHQVPTAVAEWCKEVNIDILGMRRLWRQRHVEYEKIHPFIDGNGRTGRMFMNWQRLRTGLPLLIIYTGVEQQEYYEWFK
jgi:Fic family protein